MTLDDFEEISAGEEAPVAPHDAAKRLGRQLAVILEEAVVIADDPEIGDKVRDTARPCTPLASIEPLPVTFVYNGQRVFYDVRSDSGSFPTAHVIRARRVQRFPGDQFLGAARVTVVERFEREQLAYWIAGQRPPLQPPSLRQRICRRAAIVGALRVAMLDATSPVIQAGESSSPNRRHWPHNMRPTDPSERRFQLEWADAPAPGVPAR